MKNAALHPSMSKKFRRAAEWEAHETTWIAWPHNKNDWPGKITTVHWVYGEITRKLVQGEQVCIIVQSGRHEQQAIRVLTRAGVDMQRVRFFQFSTNRGWTRDFGPLFIKREGRNPEAAIARVRFTGWGKYPDFELDNKIPDLVARKLKLRITPVEHEGRKVVLEGGSIDCNGCGAIMTTEECLLDPAVQIRNPGFCKEDYESVFRDFLGCRNVIWLGRGIAGDDTHGHIDDLCRFVNPRTVVLCKEDDPSDINHSITKENNERLADVKLEDGSKVDIIRLPMPSPLHFKGQRLPASYANFYISNSAVLLPTFNDVNDRVALGILGELFPDRDVIGIHAVDLVWGLGTIHCLTNEQPAI